MLKWTQKTFGELQKKPKRTLARNIERPPAESYEERHPPGMQRIREAQITEIRGLYVYTKSAG